MLCWFTLLMLKPGLEAMLPPQAPPTLLPELVRYPPPPLPRMLPPEERPMSRWPFLRRSTELLLWALMLSMLLRGVCPRGWCCCCCCCCCMPVLWSRLCAWLSRVRRLTHLAEDGRSVSIAIMCVCVC